jgi:type IV pilus biogenesis/stability protein PilW
MKEDVKPRKERLTIAHMGHRGDGVVQGADGPIYIPYALPGETVEAERKGDRAQVLSIVEASPDRIEPVCPHFGTCGGCAVQHWREDKYRTWKRDLVVSALAQEGIDAPVEDLIDAHGEGRRRAVLHAKRGGRNVLVVGFTGRRSHIVVPIDQCPIFAPPLERALEIDPRSSDAHVLLAIVYQAEGAYTRAEDHYRRAIRLDRANSMALNNFGSFLHLRERYAEARPFLQRAAEDSSYGARPQAFENLGLTELAIGNVDDAATAFTRALRLNPDLPRSHLELAEIHFERGNNAAAMTHFERYRALAQQTPRSLWIAIRLHGAMQDRDAVASFGLQLRNLFPGSDEYRLYQDGFQ